MKKGWIAYKGAMRWLSKFRSSLESAQHHGAAYAMLWDTLLVHVPSGQGIISSVIKVFFYVVVEISFENFSRSRKTDRLGGLID